MSGLYRMWLDGMDREEMDRAGLGSVGLGWALLGWAGLGRVLCECVFLRLHQF